MKPYQSLFPQQRYKKNLKEQNLTAPFLRFMVLITRFLKRGKKKKHLQENLQVLDFQKWTR